MPTKTFAAQDNRARRSTIVLAVLSLIGLGISAYLWSAKTGSLELICGAMGDCVSVNASIYSEVAGIPVAAAGTVMYACLAVLSLLAKGPMEHRVVWIGFVLSLAGALFSLYLTGIEAFVLKMYCIWCLTSWVLITIIAVLWGRHLAALSDSPQHQMAPKRQ